MREVFTPEQVAELFQLNKDTVYRLIRARKLAATRIGRSYRIPRQDIEAFLRRNSTFGELRQMAWDRLLAIGARNQDIDSDTLLDELEIANVHAAVGDAPT